MSGAFAQWQPRYAEHRVPTFPVAITPEHKKPMVKHFDRIGVRYSKQLALRFPASGAFAFAAGRRSGLTVIDLDTRDERKVTEALATYGPTPFLVRTPRKGFHLYYRHNGEPRRVRHGDSLDLLGGGMVIAPPSDAPAGGYEIIEGTLADLDRLPVMRFPAKLRSNPAHDIASGRRNDALFRFALEQVRHVDNLDALLDVVRTRNLGCDVPLPDTEVERIVKSSWRYEQEGRNLMGRGAAVVTEHRVIDALAIASDPDAAFLFLILRRHHWGRHFVVANAMADGLRWNRKRFAAARTRLVELGLLREVQPAKRHAPAVYSFRVVDFDHQ